MSERFSGGFITKTPVVPTTSSASGIWTLDQQEQAQQAGIWPQQPNPQYIEDVFSTYLTTGTGTTQTVTNGIDLSTYGGMVWNKIRSTSANNYLMDSARNNFDQLLYSNTTDAGINLDFINPTTSGFNFVGAALNNSGQTYANWTFRKQPKFFDVVTFTGDYTAKTISHNLGSIPGTIIVKSLNNAQGWYVYHRSLGATKYLTLQTTNGELTNSTIWNDTEPTSTQFSVGTNGNVNGDGTYVAYLFAHNAGGFGLTGTDNVISCGSFTTDASGNASVNLGYEPQFLLYKVANNAGQWEMVDVMRGDSLTSISRLFPNASQAEATSAAYGLRPTSTGFETGVAGYFDNSKTYIYIAIRRGPMKVPTDATKVFVPVARTGTGATTTITSGFVTDLSISQIRNGAALGAPNGFFDRLRGATKDLSSNTTDAEITYADSLTSFASNTSITVGADSASGAINYGGTNYANWMFQRAPSFFDEVCYTGNNNGVGQTLSHNLATVPELMIVKRRGNVGAWLVYSTATGAANYLMLQDTAASAASSTVWQNTAPTATQFTIGQTPNQADTYVAYLFATCAGVSKVGSYTGNGSTQTINCGFTGGARFVLIKRTDSTGDWYVYDTARGMTVLTDPYLLLNSTAAESATLGSVTTVSTGFAVNASILAAINTSGASYIFLAIA